NNIVDYFSLRGAMWMKDNNRSDHFIYKEHINAAYFNISKESKKWDMQLGFRVENTVSKGNQISMDTVFTNEYTHFFPNVSLTYHINTKNDIGASYGRRINRPNYNSLNPFITFADSIDYVQGNPSLKAELNNNFELTYTYKKINTTLNYSHTVDAIKEVDKQNTATKASYITYENIKALYNIGIAINAPIMVQKWWTSNIYASLYNNHYKGFFGSDILDISATSVSLKINNSFTITKSLTAEITGSYDGSRSVDLRIHAPYYGIRVGVAKSILQQKGSLKFTLQSYNLNATVNTRYGNVDNSFMLRSDNRKVILSFSYRFGKLTVPKAKEHNSATEEKSRASG
nr:outer membrane beta-barrel family protein [Chitinophagaceae bacterium]